jgi:tetraacyldisaccharide 4'-kinase
MSLLKRIEAIMKSDGEASPAILRSGLSAISHLYGGGVRLRTVAYDRGTIKTNQLPCIVISIGNLTVGGTGKTPLTLYMAQLVQRLGYQVVILSRGYGGSAESSGGIVSDGQRIHMQADECGDEPYMMARRLRTVPILVGKSRYQSGLLAVKRFQPDVILLDDAFQHRRLARDLDLVLLDAEKPIGNGHLFPRGILREPAASLKRSHAVIFTRTEKTAHLPQETIQPFLKTKPVFYSHHKPCFVKHIIENSRSGKHAGGTPQETGFDFMRGKHVLAFAGIARNEDFFNMIPDFGCAGSDVISFSDHHRYSPYDIQHIQQVAIDGHADCLLTTEKDFYRMAPSMDWPLDLVVMGVDLVFKDNGFDAFILERVASLLSEKPFYKDSPQ